MICSRDLSSAEIYPATWLQMTVVHLYLVFDYDILFLPKKGYSVVMLCKFGKLDNTS